VARLTCGLGNNLIYFCKTQERGSIKMYKITITAEVSNNFEVDCLMNAYNGMDMDGLFPNGSDFSYDGEPEPDPNAPIRT